MGDIEIIHEYMLGNEKDAVSLEILVGKVSDQRMAMGMLVDMSMRPDAYRIDRDIVMHVIASNIEESMMNTEYLKSCHSEYYAAMQAKNDNELKKNEFSAKAIIAILLNGPDSNEATEALSQGNIEHLSYLKEMMLESEAYEYIGVVDREIERKKTEKSF